MFEVSLFYGIKITMNYDEMFDENAHPYFRAEYAGNIALINILESTILSSWLPKRQLKLVLAWNELHRDELMQNWELVKAGRDLNPITPLV